MSASDESFKPILFPTLAQKGINSGSTQEVMAIYSQPGPEANCPSDQKTKILTGRFADAYDGANILNSIMPTQSMIPATASSSQFIMMASQPPAATQSSLIIENEKPIMLKKKQVKK